MPATAKNVARLEAWIGGDGDGLQPGGQAGRKTNYKDSLMAAMNQLVFNRLRKSCFTAYCSSTVFEEARNRLFALYRRNFIPLFYGVS